MIRMRLKLGLLTAAAVLLAPMSTASQKYLPEFPRECATELKSTNGFIIWDVAWEKGKSTGMRQLALDQVEVTLSEGAVKVSFPDGTWSIQQKRFGSVVFQSKGTIMAEEGVDDVPSHSIVFQLREVVPTRWPVTEGVPGMFPRAGAVELFETDRIRVWDSSFKVGERISRHLHYIETAGVFLNGGVIRSIANGVPNRPLKRSAGEVFVTSRIDIPHEEEQVEGLPRAIWVEFK
jgi:hypothetical protein